MSLYVLGFPDRTNESQYAMSSSAKAVEMGDIGVNVEVPLRLQGYSEHVVKILD